MAKKPAQPAVTAADLKDALKRDWSKKYQVFDRYSKQKPTEDAIPWLRKALADSYHGTVKCAAVSLRKLGPQAVAAMDDLLAAAYLVDDFHMPQAYPECLEAMMAIDPGSDELIPLIKHFTGLDNWVPTSASLRALKTIGTPEALDLFERFAAFWEPELNKMQRRVVEQLRGKR